MPRIEISHEDDRRYRPALVTSSEPGVVLTRAEVVHRVLVEWAAGETGESGESGEKWRKRHNLPYLSIRGPILS